MNAVNKLRKRQQSPVRDTAGGGITEKTLEHRLAWAAGTEKFEHRDPIYHLTESFKQVFDALGGRGFDGEGEGGVFGQFMKDNTPGLTDTEGKKLRENEGDTAQPQNEERARAMGKTSMNPYYRQRDMYSGDRLMTKFAEVTFSRGVMGGAILNGTGQMMLFNCLKRTVGQSQPKNVFQGKLFQQSSAHRLVKGYPQDKMIFNKGFTDSAVGLVVDVLRDSRRVVDSLSEIVSGNVVNSENGTGADTLEKMYPFLSTKKEEALLGEYDSALASLGNSPKDDESRQALLRAKQRLGSMIEKKNQMKTEFVSKLRYISESAQKAQALFSTEEFKQEIYNSLVDYSFDEPNPPDDNAGDEKGEKDEELNKKSLLRSRQPRHKRKEE